MKKSLLACFAFTLVFATPLHAGLFDDLLGGLGESGSSATSTALSLEKTVSGLKEALSVGTGNAVGSLSKLNGYFGDEAIKILMPEKIQNVADVLKQMGLDKPVDDFVLSMNQAAEKAATEAKPIFIDAIKEMSFEDAKQILNGGDTAATEYLDRKTRDKIAKAFQPVISAKMNEVGATRYYQEMTKQFDAIPFMKSESVDLDPYVTNKALDGLFHTVALEEKKIRTNPQARVTDILKEVFEK